MPPVSLESYFVDAEAPAAPPGFAVLRATFDAVPRELALADGWSAIVYLPTGTARPWIDGDPAVVVSASQHEFAPHAADDDSSRTIPARLVIRRAGALLGALPLASGVAGTFAAPSTMLEIVPLTWEIRAGAMRGGVPGSARIELAFRSLVVAPGVITTGGAPESPGAVDGGTPVAARVIVSAESPSGRNVEFLDVATRRIMTREEFVGEIRAGRFPAYEVRTIRGVATPVSRATPVPHDNLG